MKTLSGKTRLAFLAFFSSHIPATLCIDSQALLGQFIIYPQALQDLLSWYSDFFHDDLMKPPKYENWIRAIICVELIFQLPFFFVACYMIWNSTSRSTYHFAAGSGWFKSACMVYGAHTATTLIPILACHIFDNEGASLVQKVRVVSIHLPYLIFPLWLVCIACANENIFGERQQISTKKKL